MSIVDILIALLFAGLISAGLGKAIAQHTDFLINARKLLTEDSNSTSHFVKTDITSCMREEASSMKLFYCEQSEERGAWKNTFLSE